MPNTNTTQNDIQNKIIKQKLNQNNDVFLYIKTNVKYKPTIINDSAVTQNGDSILLVYNKGNLLSQNTHAFTITSMYKYILKDKVTWVWIVKFKIKDILAKPITKIEITDCTKILKKYKYYINLESNKYNDICLGSNNQIWAVKGVKLTKVIENTKVYPNALGITPQLWPINITVPITIGLILSLLVLGFYFFKKKYA